MKIIGVMFCILSIALVYKKLTFMIYGKSAIGTIIGFGSSVSGTRGFYSYPYLVKFEYNNQVYIAKSIESALGSYNGVFSEINYNKKVNVFFKEDNPEVVTIKEFKDIYVISLCMFLLGLIGVIYL
ncbi:hypothetical protein [Parvimonas sp. G1967]|uniref:hypothetical protein n=1 Tax=Parvimonas sp. G1967 TaxID=3387695 RepID=UPI0039E50988